MTKEVHYYHQNVAHDYWEVHVNGGRDVGLPSPSSPGYDNPKHSEMLVQEFCFICRNATATLDSGSPIPTFIEKRNSETLYQPLSASPHGTVADRQSRILVAAPAP